MSTPFDHHNLVVLSGELSAEPRRRTLPSGSQLVEFDVTTRPPAGTASVPVSWFDPPAGADALAAGTTVVVVGTVRRRFFRAGGVTQSRTEVLAHRVEPASRAVKSARLFAAAVAALDGNAAVD